MIDAFYADPHFGHANIIGYEGRPFSSVEEMNRGLIERYNAKIDAGALVIWLGDVSSKAFRREIPEVVRAMRGRKILVPGNHDHSIGEMLDVGFSAVIAGPAYARIAGRNARLSHYPYADVRRDGDDRFLDRCPPRIEGEILIHGHTHGSTVRVGNAINVGVDAWDYGPAMWAEVEALASEV